MESISVRLRHQAFFYEYRLSEREPEPSNYRAKVYHSFDSKPTPMVIEIPSESELSDTTVISGCPIDKEEEVEMPQV